LRDVVSSLKLRKLAFVGQYLEAAIANFGLGGQISYVVNSYVWVVFEFEIVDSLEVGIEPLFWCQKAPIWLLRLVERQLLQVFESSLDGRHREINEYC
jgi:hypothetical protein